MQSVTGVAHYLAADVLREIELLTKDGHEVEVFRAEPLSGRVTGFAHLILRMKTSDGKSHESLITMSDPAAVDLLLKAVKLLKPANTTPLSLSAIIIPEKKVAEGTLIKTVSMAWGAIVEKLGHDWDHAYQISPVVWEEIIAAAYHKAGSM